MYIRILGWMFVFNIGPEMLAELATSVTRCHDAQKDCVQLGELYFNHWLRLCRWCFRTQPLYTSLLTSVQVRVSGKDSSAAEHSMRSPEPPSAETAKELKYPPKNHATAKRRVSVVPVFLSVYECSVCTIHVGSETRRLSVFSIRCLCSGLSYGPAWQGHV